MYNGIYCTPVKKIKVSVTDFIMYKVSYRPEELLQSFLEESRRCYYTSLRFPSRVADGGVLQAQSQNYDYFIYTMAEMMKKYAPEILE